VRRQDHVLQPLKRAFEWVGIGAWFFREDIDRSPGDPAGPDIAREAAE
jgi:hypothetical protein